MDGLIKVIGGATLLVIYISILALGLAVCSRVAVEIFQLVFSL